MELSVVSSILGEYSLDESLSYLKSIGVNQLELGVGGYPGKAHADALVLCKDEGKRKELVDTFKKYGMTISALSVHGNNVHPNPEIADKFQKDFEAACILCGQLGVDTLVTFSGCPGSDKDAKQPSWVTCAWPTDFKEVLDYQWNEVLIPYWKKAAKFAADHGVKKIAFELHPGFCVYNPATLLRIREAVGDIIGANLDPSHLFWQGIDILSAITAMKGAIHYFHAKDTYLNEANIKVNGVLDTTPLSELADRSWIFRTLGFGHGALEWKQIISALKLAGYDGTISIEHEDGLMDPKEGLEKAVDFIKGMIIKGANQNMWWA
ncbi:MAG: sugar phosphate isomerase/epimerase [Clostridia bacterium]|nr:sugar phosphate isomerase/epimerase [Clostridia bacterium]